MGGWAEQAVGAGGRRGIQEADCELRAGLDRAGGEHKEPTAVTCPLAGRAQAASPAQKLWQWAPVELRPGPGRAAKLAWHFAEGKPQPGPLGCPRAGRGGDVHISL